MFTVIINAAKYIWGEKSRPIDADINNVFNKLKVASNEIDDFNDELSIVENQNNKGCFYKNGIVTHITENSLLIDNCYFCDSENVLCPNLNIGTKVYYMGYQKNEHFDPIVRKIISIVDNYNNYDESMNEQVIRNQMIKKYIVVKVIKREGRIIYCYPLNIKFNLDKIISSFIPYVGDWLKLESLVELDQESGDLSGEILEVEKIQPLRSKLKVGLINKFDLQTGVGIVDSDTIFVKASCHPGYIPCVGDKVVCDSIESDQGIYTWRCLKVVPLQQIINNNEIPKEAIINSSRKIIDKNLKILLQNKHGISITDNLLFDMNINEKKELQIFIKNSDNITHILNKCVFMSKKSMSQLSLISPDASTAISIKSNETVTYTFQCTSQFVGSTEELVIFCFKNFTIGRQFKIIVNTKNLSTMTNSNTLPYNYYKLARQDKEDSYIPGIRPWKPPSFITVRSGVFRVPQRMWDIILPCINQKMSQIETQSIIAKAFPCLDDTLTPNNYKDRFHALLYLEEISLNIDLQKYDLDSASMIPFDEYLVLKVPGLAEKRPSLIVGDRAIVTFKWDSSAGNVKHEGFVHKVNNSEVHLKFSPNFHSTYNSEDCQVTFKSSYSTIGRCHNAINLAISHLGPKILFPTSIIVKESQIHLDENPNEKSNNNMNNENKIVSPTTMSPGGKYAKLAALLSKIEAQKQNNSINSIESYNLQIKKRKLIWFNKQLNYYQKQAVRNILCGVARPLPYIIYGPPGTGKTITLCETILQILITIPESRLLIATPSNSSANLIAERLLDSGALKPGDMVRLVANHYLNDDSIPERLLPYCATGNLASEHSTKNYSCTIKGTRLNCTMSVLGRHRITVGTCTALGLLYNMGFPLGHFSHILVDEAGQATEPEIMIPLSFFHSSCGQIILVGDPMQLGPVVNSRLASYFGLSESFLARLLQQFPYQHDTESFEMGYDPRLVTKLVINYRSLPEILNLPNSLFYDFKLKANISSTTSSEAEFLRSIASELPNRIDGPPAIVFHGVNGENCQDSDSPSWYNPAEATQAYLYLLKLYNHGVNENDIGIITPYKKQVWQIRALLTELDMQMPKIGSVEEFQGQERKIIIVSAVRSSSEYFDNDIKYALGFIASPKRLNVAITRARALLIILGNPNLLSQDPYWRSVLNYCIKIGSYTGCAFSSNNMNFYKNDEINEMTDNS